MSGLTLNRDGGRYNLPIVWENFLLKKSDLGGGGGRCDQALEPFSHDVILARYALDTTPTSDEVNFS